MIDFNTITLLTGEAAAADAPANPGLLGTLGSLLPFLLLIPIFYFLMYRPQKKQEKETAAMRNSLMIGDEIVTIGGIIGIITNITEETITIISSRDRIRIQLLKSSVSRVQVSANASDEEKKEEKN